MFYVPDKENIMPKDPIEEIKKNRKKDKETCLKTIQHYFQEHKEMTEFLMDRDLYMDFIKWQLEKKNNQNDNSK